jgi:hypothetical protein
MVLHQVRPLLTRQRHAVRDPCRYQAVLQMV